MEKHSSVKSFSVIEYKTYVLPVPVICLSFFKAISRSSVAYF